MKIRRFRRINPDHQSLQILIINGLFNSMYACMEWWWRKAKILKNPDHQSLQILIINGLFNSMHAWNGGGARLKS
jgi:hypothetical protein